ncbi:MAG: helix-turn-helix domain-containing protein [Faecalibacterium sp.]|jgi:transcriptional regulator with XRE-family HTH domain|nr:helix-turn-helix domain-containing protein [Faecalibacterium sp.]
MPMQEILRQKRKALGLTQEQVAKDLGVTTPAVNKWENGVTCPDLMLLPALARLLKTDPNTLLCFREDLTDHEIAVFSNTVAEEIRTKGFAQGYTLAIEKTQEYPNCAKLLYSAAILLDGALLMQDLSKLERQAHRAEITALYERVARCSDADLAYRAQYMLASTLLQQEKYEEAQQMLDQLPKQRAPDKRSLQANLWAKMGKSAEAAKLLSNMALGSLQESLVTLSALVSPLIVLGDTQTAERLAQAAKAQCEAFGLWPYSACLLPMQVAVAKKDVPESLRLLSSMLGALLAPWDAYAGPLYRYQPHKEGSDAIGKTFLPAVLSDLESNPDYDFLRAEPEFKSLLETYRAKAE